MEEWTLDTDSLQSLFRYCYALCREPSAAEDLLHTALEKALRKPVEVMSQSYLRTIIRNQFIDQCRRQSRVAFEPIEDHLPTLLSITTLEEVWLQQLTIEEIFSQLTAAEGEILYLWAMEGFTAEEIATETGQSRGTVLSRLHRIKQKATEGIPSPLQGGLE